MRSEKTFDMARADSIQNLKLDLGDTYPVAINLEKAMRNPEVWTMFFCVKEMSCKFHSSPIR